MKYIPTSTSPVSLAYKVRILHNQLVYYFVSLPKNGVKIITEVKYYIDSINF